jgi:hypothetical protein
MQNSPEKPLPSGYTIPIPDGTYKVIGNHILGQRKSKKAQELAAK